MNLHRTEPGATGWGRALSGPSKVHWLNAPVPHRLSSQGEREKLFEIQDGAPLMLSVSKHGVGFFNGLPSA